MREKQSFPSRLLHILRRAGLLRGAGTWYTDDYGKSASSEAREGDPNGKKQQPGKRILMSALGVAICGVSVDPFQSLMSGLDAVIPIHFGTLYVIANLLLLTFALVFDRRKIGLATLINLFLLRLYCGVEP